MKIAFALFCLLPAALLAPAANAAGPELRRRPNFGELMEKIIRPRCLECHNEKHAQRQVYLETYEDLTSYAVSGKPNESLLYEVLTPRAFVQMPFGREPLSAKEVKYVKAWIARGFPQ